MSKQTSLITFTGKMAGISFYQKDGVHYARRANGPSKSRILTDPKFERTRENLQEFAGLATAAASFTKAFASVKNLSDGQFRSRVVKVLRAIAKRSDGIRGQRPILLSQHRELFLNIEVNATQNFLSSFAARFTASHNNDRNNATINVTGLNASSMVTAPPSATHFQLVQLLSVVADTVYNQNLSAYEPTNALVNTMGEVNFSDYIPLSLGEPVSLSLETTLPNATVPGNDVTIIQSLGIMFFEQIGLAYYPLNQGKAMKIVNVF